MSDSSSTAALLATARFPRISTARVDVETAGLTKVVKNNQIKDETEAEQTAGRG